MRRGPSGCRSSTTPTTAPDPRSAEAAGYLYLVPADAKGFGQRRFLGDGMRAYDQAG